MFEEPVTLAGGAKLGSIKANTTPSALGALLPFRVRLEVELEAGVGLDSGVEIKGSSLEVGFVGLGRSRSAPRFTSHRAQHST